MRTMILAATLLLSQTAKASNYVPNQLGCLNEENLQSIEIILPLDEQNEGWISEKILFKDPTAQVFRIENVRAEIPRGGKSEYKVLHLQTEKGDYRLHMAVAYEPFKMPPPSYLTTPDEEKLECQFLGKQTTRSEVPNPDWPSQPVCKHHGYYWECCDHTTKTCWIE